MKSADAVVLLRTFMIFAVAYLILAKFNPIITIKQQAPKCIVIMVIVMSSLLTCYCSVPLFCSSNLSPA